MTDAAGPRVLFCAFAEVPGATAVGVRMAQWLSVFGTQDTDALSLKGRETPHLQRLGGARLMRVPHTSGKPSYEKLSTYQRALQRQLRGEEYDLVWCADLFSAAAVAPILRKTAPLIIEVSQGHLLMEEMEENVALSKEWRDAEGAALRRSATVFLPSRRVAQLISERGDPGLVQVVPRCVDRSVFSPPSVEIDVHDERLVLIFGGREGGARLKAALTLAESLALALPDNVHIAILGTPTPGDGAVRTALGNLGLHERIQLVDATGSAAVAAALSLAHVIIVPSRADDPGASFTLPHRALEAMACGRAVVVSGPEAARGDAAVSGEHYISAGAADPRRVVAAVTALLADPVTRASLGRAAARHVERTADLLSRADEVRQLVADSTGVMLTVHAPNSDGAGASSASLSASRGPSPAPVVLAEVTMQGDDDTSVALDLTPRSSSGHDVFAPTSTRPMFTERMVAPSFSSSSLDASVQTGTWSNDTFLDGGLEPLPVALETSPDAAHVRAAMRVSSEGHRKAEEAAPSITFAFERPRLPGETAAPDTIADGSPIFLVDEGVRAGLAAAIQVVPGRANFLVDAGSGGHKARDPGRETTKILLLDDESEADKDQTMEDQPSTPPERLDRP